MTQVNYSFSLQTKDGLSVTLPGNNDVDIIDSGNITVQKGKEVPINIQPLAWDKVEFIIIQSNGYDKDGKLTYSVGKATNTPLRQAHFLMGNALVKLLGTATGDVKIKNNTTADVAVKVIVGREVA